MAKWFFIFRKMFFFRKPFLKDMPYFCTMNANAGIDFGNSAIAGNLFGAFTGFLFPQEKLDDYASDLQNLFNTMDLTALENPTYGSYGVLPLINLSAELGTITTEFE